MMMTTRHLLLSAAILALTARGVIAQQPAQPPALPPAGPAPSQAARPAAAAPAVPAATTSNPDLPRVTLAEALRLAAQASPAMVQARQNVRTAQWGQRTALGAYLPSLSGSASGSKAGAERYNSATGQRVTNPYPYSESYGLSARVNLFTGFQRGANTRAASATTDLREAAQLQQEYATVLSTKQAFFTALAAAELVTVAETQLRRSGEQLKLTSEKLRLGATTRSDSLGAMVDYGNSQLQLIQARANLQYAQVNLGRIIGTDGAVAPVPDTALEARLGPLDTAALRLQALATAPSVRQSEASLAAARASLAAQRARWMPTVSASWSQNWSRSTSGIRDTIPWLGSWSFGLALSYPLFNGFQRESSIATADANVITAQANLRDAQLALDANLTQAVSGLTSAAQQIDIARSSVAAAEENLRMQQERYRLGTSTIVDLLTSQTALNQAQANLVSARYNYLVARAQIEALVGHGL
jgi:outer membrane protein